MGYGEYQAVMPNTSEIGRNANRRVEVMIMGRDSVEQVSRLGRLAQILLLSGSSGVNLTPVDRRSLSHEHDMATNELVT
jgi:hypothetical protein